jgi:hypothetical protein
MLLDELGVRSVIGSDDQVKQYLNPLFLSKELKLGERREGVELKKFTRTVNYQIIETHYQEGTIVIFKCT